MTARQANTALLLAMGAPEYPPYMAYAPGPWMRGPFGPIML
jgi:hypothetical protein